MSSVSSTLGKTFPLEQQKLMLEIQDLEHTCGNRSKKDVLENKKLELEIDSPKLDRRIQTIRGSAGMGARIKSVSIRIGRCSNANLPKYS